MRPRLKNTVFPYGSQRLQRGIAPVFRAIPLLRGIWLMIAWKHEYIRIHFQKLFLRHYLTFLDTGESLRIFRVSEFAIIIKNTSPSAVADYYMEQMRHLETETAVLVMLDNRMALLREEVLSLGTVNCTLLSPREIFLRAIRWGAVNILLLHNHPSGDPTPSRMDREVTERISRAGHLLGIELIDHLIIGDLCYTSLRECGCISDQIPSSDGV